MTQASVLPAVAPLSASLATHTFQVFQQKVHRSTVMAPLDEPLEEMVARVIQERNAEYQAYQHAVDHHRTTAYRLLTPYLPTGTTLSTEAVLAALAEMNHAVSAQTLSRWRDHSLLRYRQYNHAEASSVAAILITALLLSGRSQRIFLPSEGDSREPLWWCFRQDAPDAPVVPCPVPLPADLPPSALLWTPWEGAAWDVAWLHVGTLGAIRWAGTVVEHDKLLWQVSLADLERWVPEVLVHGKELAITREILHTLANVALLHLARARFAQAFATTS